MKLITISGPPSSGKTSVILRLIESLREGGMEKIGVVKFDCLTSFDQVRYREAGIPVEIGFSGKVCPDHFFISNIEDAVKVYEENIAMRSNGRHAYDRLKIIYRRQKDRENEIRVLRVAIGVFGEDSEYNERLLKLLSKTKEPF